jgi:hypothetical protein
VVGTTVWLWHQARRLWFPIGGTPCRGTPVTLCGARLTSTVSVFHRNLPDHADFPPPPLAAPPPNWTPVERAGCRRCVSTMYDGPIGDHRKSCGCPCVADGCEHTAPDHVHTWVSEQQRRLRDHHGGAPTPRTRAQLRAEARWLELEAMRGYPGSASERQAATNRRWLVELLDAGVDINRPFAELVRERRSAEPEISAPARKRRAKAGGR